MGGGNKTPAEKADTGLSLAECENVTRLHEMGQASEKSEIGLSLAECDTRLPEWGQTESCETVPKAENNENRLSLEKDGSDSENAENCDINLGAISDDNVLKIGGNETDLEGMLEERGNSVQMVQCEGENVANNEHFVRGGDAKKEQGNGGHNVPGDSLVQGGQGCGGDNSDQMVQSVDDKNVQNSDNLNVPDDMTVNGVHGELPSEDNSEQMLRGGDMENVQGNSEQNVPVEVNVELREVLEKLCMVVTLDEGRDEPRIVGCNVARGGEL